MSRAAKVWRSLLTAVALLPAPVLADEFDGVRQAIRQSMLEDDVPGLAVAIWRDGQILWEEGFGWADLENRVPANPHTMFNLASLSKTLTATALMTLVEAGRVDLDKPANDYLAPDVLTSRIGDPRAVTVRSIANHTSGLPGSDQWFYGTAESAVPSMSEVIRRYGILVAPAGERHRYSNLGYGVLGQLIARASGDSYADYMRKAVFMPLGMSHSAMDPGPPLERYRAVRYDFDRKPLATVRSAEPASASIYSSVHDLARFGMFFLKARLPDQRPILSDAAMEAMTRDPIFESATPVRPAGPDEDGYAVGWITSHGGGYRLIGHSGSASGVSTNLLLVPEKKVGVVMVANADQVFLPTTVALKSVLPDWRDAPAAGKPKQSDAPAFSPAPQLVGTWQGTLHTYEGTQPVVLKVWPSGEVHVRIGGEPKFQKRSTVRQEALVTQVQFKDGMLSGTSLAQIETSDTQRHRHVTSLSLKLRGDTLNGVTSADAVYEGLWLYGLPHWTELKKVSRDAPAR